MAKSYVVYQGDGVTDTYAVPFAYLAKLHVRVLIAGNIITEYQWLTDSSIKLDVASNDIVTIQRTTPTTPIVDFTDGSVLTENQLDIATIQSLYVAEETQDSVDHVLNNNPGTDGEDGSVPGDGVNWNANNKKMINLAPGTNDKDAINKAQLDAAAPELSGEVEKAKQEADRAEDEADRAQDIADSLKADVDGANAAAANAKASELAAKASEEAALVSQTEAALSATQAEASNVAAKAAEDAAKESAAEAKEAEDGAKDSAANAALVAEFVEDARADAEESADEAAASAAAAALSAAESATSASASKDSADKAEMHEKRTQEIADDFNPALLFKGSIDVTMPAPVSNEPGDAYVVEATAVADDSFVGIAGETVVRDSMVIYGADFDWSTSGMSGGLDGYSKSEVDAMLDALDAVPAGLISIWSGAADAIPEDWTLCDGTDGAPDLRDKFVVGAGTTYAVSAAGGSANAVNVSHTHPLSIAKKTGLNASWKTINRGGSSGSSSLLFTRTGSAAIANMQGSHSNGWKGESGSQSTKITLTLDHNHTGNATAAGVSGTGKNLPPYYALCYIMKQPKSLRRTIANRINGTQKTTKGSK